LSDVKTNGRLIILTNISIKAKSLVKIGRAHAEIIGKIFAIFFAQVQK